MTHVVAVAITNPEVRLGKERVVGKVVSAKVDESAIEEGAFLVGIEITDDDFYQSLTRGGKYIIRITAEANPARQKG
jgi:hypothetical protein